MIYEKDYKLSKCNSKEWVKGKLKPKGTALEIKFDDESFLKLSNQKIEVYACKNCGFIELYMAEKTKEKE